MRILLVEDDPTDAKLMGIYCSRAFAQVGMDWAVTTAEARQSLQTEQFDLCIFDFLLQENTSAALMNDLARLNPQLPIIVVSNLSEAAMREKGLRQSQTPIFSKQNFDENTLRLAFATATAVKH